MKQQLSPLQLALIIANFIFSGTIISVQQIIVEVSKQNSWLVILLTYPIVLGIVLLICHNTDKIEKMKGLLDTDNKSWFHRIFVIILFLLFLFIFIRDFRSFNGFVDAILLPDTPIDIIAVLTILTLIYISLTGIEVIARITVIHYFTVCIIVVALPLLLMNEIDFRNSQPIGGANSVSEILKSSYIFVPWMAEVVIITFLVIFVAPLDHIKKASILGTSLSFILLLVLITMNISVLGVAVTSEATYPNIAIIQQINLTDFLDRLDLVIIVVWIPTMLCKLSLVLFAIQKLMNVLRAKDSDFSIVPLGLFLGLTTHLFKSNIDSIEYSFFTWPLQGLLLEILLIVFFLLMKHKQIGLKGSSGKKKNENA